MELLGNITEPRYGAGCLAVTWCWHSEVSQPAKQSGSQSVSGSADDRLVWHAGKYSILVVVTIVATPHTSIPTRPTVITLNNCY